MSSTKKMEEWMIELFLMILKVIGMVLLLLLCLLLVIMFLFLFVPLRYHIVYCHGETSSIKVSVSWLLHIISIRYVKDENRKFFKLKILGILVRDFLAERKAKRKRKKSTKGKKSKVKSQTKTTKQNSPSKNIDTDKAEDKTEVRIEEKVEEKIEENQLDKDDVSSKDGVLEKIKLRILGFVKKIKDKLISILETIKKLLQRVQIVIDFISNGDNKASFSFFFQTLKNMLKRLGPTRIRSELVLGTGDPCSTGQALGVISILCAKTNYKVKITPDFTQKVLEGRHDIRGRIIPVSVLSLVIKTLLNKNTKSFMKNIRILKEAL